MDIGKKELTLVFNGHIDVVPLDNLSQWTLAQVFIVVR